MTTKSPLTSGFTLIELLVVITIIVVLLALLTPALDKAIEQAERAVCASNLHAWGRSHHTYSMDNKRRIMSTLRTSSTYPNPNMCWGDQSQGLNAQGTAGADWSAGPIAPYAPGTDMINYWFHGIWVCPSNGATLKDQQSNNMSTGVFGAGIAGIVGFFQPDYAYFAHSEIWGARHATQPEKLTGPRLAGSDRILMTDVIWKWHVDATWWYNHGEDGFSVHQVEWGGPVSTVPRVSGQNQLFNDGSVAWKRRTEFDWKLMQDISMDIPWVSHQSNDDQPDNSGDGDVSYY